MPRKKPKPFRAVTAVKAAARQVVGSPRATRVETPARKLAKKAQKHKPPLGKLLAEE